MLHFVGRRLLAVVPLLLIVTAIAFSLLLLLPGDAAVAMLGLENATAERLAVGDGLREALDPRHARQGAAYP